MPSIILALSCLAQLAHGTPDGFIWINVSVKFIVDPASGTVPSSPDVGTDGVDDELLKECFNLVNKWQAATKRGYRVRLVDLNPNLSFKRIGTMENNPPDTNPAYWYNVNIKGGDPGTIDAQNRDRFEDRVFDSENNPYLWNPNAVNIYVNNNDYSSTSHKMLITSYRLIAEGAGPNYYKSHPEQIAGNLHHEIGHYFGQPHTFETEYADTVSDDNGPNNGVFDRLAQLKFNLNFNQLDAAQQVRVNNTVYNLMSYHQAVGWSNFPQADWFTKTNILTQAQLDLYAHTANSTRLSNVSGSTIFVDASAFPNGDGTDLNPLKTLGSAVTAASDTGGDILLLRPGTYEATTLNKPMTLRAATGSVTLQHP